MADVDAAGGVADPLDPVVADGHQGQRTLHARVHEAQVVDDVAAFEGLQHQAEGDLGPRLGIEHLGVGAAGHAKGGQAVVMAHGQGDALAIGLAVGAGHGLHVLEPAAPAGDDDRRAFAHQLGQDDAQQHPGPLVGRVAGDAVGPIAQGDVQLGQALAGQEHALLQGLLVGDADRR